MAENNLDNDLLEQATREAQQFNRAVGSVTRGETALTRAESEEIKLAQKKTQANRLRMQSMQIAGNGLATLGKNLTSGGSSFRPITAAITTLGRTLNRFASSFGSIGRMVGSVMETAAEGLNHVITTFEKTYGSFESLSDAGLVDKFETLRDISVQTRLKSETLNSVIGKSSKDLATFAGGALRGAQEFKKLATVNLQARERFFTMGLSVEEYAETQAHYLGTLGTVFAVEQQNFKIAQLNFPAYLQNLTMLSKITGKTRTDLRNQMSDLTRDNRFRAFIQGKDQDTIIRANNLVAIMDSIGGPSMGKAIKETIAAGGQFAQDSEDYKKLFLSLRLGGVDLNEITKQRVEGVISEEDFINTINQGLGKYADRLKTTVSQTGDMDAGVKYSIARDMQAFKPREVIDESKLTEQQRKKLQEERNKDKSLAITRINMSDMGTSLETLMTGSDLVMKGFEKVVGGVDKIIDLAYKAAGKEVPEEIKRNREISKKLSGVTEQENKLKKLDERNRQMSTDITAFEKRKQAGETLSSEDNYVLEKLKKEQKSLEKERIQKQKDIHNLNLEINTLTGNSRLDTGNRSNGELIISSGTPGGTTSSQPARLGTLGGSASGSTTGATNTSGAPAVGTTTPASPTSASQTPDASSGQPPERRSDTSGEANGGIGVIRDLISSVESVGGSYDSLFGKGTTVPLSRMTISQVLDYQLGMKKQGARSTAAGRYQFMDYTLPEYVRKARLNMDTTMFDPRHQDLLADILIREKGYDRYKSGQITATQFLNNLSMAWAGLPSPAKGGRSYYGGDGLNRSHMSLDKALAKIGQARTGGIFKGPSTGYLTMLHGDEIVIPANDTITKQNLEDNLSGGEAGDSDIVMDLFMMLDDRVEKMIDLVSDLNHEQKMYSDI